MSVVLETVERRLPVQSPGVTEADVLHRAADLLEEFGWTQGSLGMPSRHGGKRGALCYLGSIAQAHLDFGLSADRNEYLTAAQYLGGAKGNFASIASHAWMFNDAAGRTKAQVVARLRDAAERSAA